LTSPYDDGPLVSVDVSVCRDALKLYDLMLTALLCPPDCTVCPPDCAVCHQTFQVGKPDDSSPVISGRYEAFNFMAAVHLAANFSAICHPE